jgi:2-polyprenyl-3-methyl-5-hydroxy-6-metoxy-1,4-benzoquinol methylase
VIPSRKTEVGDQRARDRVVADESSWNPADCFGENSGVNPFKRAVGRGVFPHQFAWLLDLPGRRLVLSRDELIDRLLLCGTEVVLEVGAGSGYYSVAISEHVRRLIVSDLQPEMITKARQRLQTTRLTAEYVAASAAALPFADALFDRIVLVTVFGEMADQTQFLREAWRTLKPNGLLSISEHLPDPDFTPQRRLEAALGAAGFVVTASFGAPWAYTASFGRRSVR